MSKSIFMTGSASKRHDSKANGMTVLQAMTGY